MHSDKNVLSLIVATTLTSRIIGRDNKLPWRIPSDIARFKEITLGHPVIMGRKNWESIPDKFRPLPGRTNIVLTRQAMYRAEGATIVDSIEGALEVASRSPGAEEIFVIGGEEIYRQFVPLAKRVYITWVHAPPTTKGDTHFPEIGRGWRIGVSTRVDDWHPRDEHPTSFQMFERSTA
jgi:dihydrofolate reductase